jgi:hypothetical protein
VEALQRTASKLTHTIAEAWPTIAIGGLVVAFLVLS